MTEAIPILELDSCGHIDPQALSPFLTPRWEPYRADPANPGRDLGYIVPKETEIVFRIPFVLRDGYQPGVGGFELSGQYGVELIISDQYDDIVHEGTVSITLRKAELVDDGKFVELTYDVGKYD